MSDSPSITPQINNICNICSLSYETSFVENVCTPCICNDNLTMNGTALKKKFNLTYDDLKKYNIISYKTKSKHNEGRRYVTSQLLDVIQQIYDKADLPNKIKKKILTRLATERKNNDIWKYLNLDCGIKNRTAETLAYNNEDKFPCEFFDDFEKIHDIYVNYNEQMTLAEAKQKVNDLIEKYKNMKSKETEKIDKTNKIIENYFIDNYGTLEKLHALATNITLDMMKNVILFGTVGTKTTYENYKNITDDIVKQFIHKRITEERIYADIIKNLPTDIDTID